MEDLKLKIEARLEVYEGLIRDLDKDNKFKQELIDINKRIVELGDKLGKKVVATVVYGADTVTKKIKIA